MQKSKKYVNNCYNTFISMAVKTLLTFSLCNDAILIKFHAVGQLEFSSSLSYRTNLDWTLTTTVYNFKVTGKYSIYKLLPLMSGKLAKCDEITEKTFPNYSIVDPHFQTHFCFI